jgi:hypothetical protein
MASFKNSRTFCVLNSIVTLFLKIEKNGEKKHNLTVYNHITMKKLFFYRYTFAYLGLFLHFKHLHLNFFAA